jgi:uncharacterized lipoprotein YddW (UPF0748 family)
MIFKQILNSLLIFVIVNQTFSQNIYPKRELRGVWIATVANIDWPASCSDSTQKQMADLISMFDKLKAAGINTVFFQVRTECDAFYNSPYEPWSYWLTGEQGKAPNPFYDPLAFAIAEAHKRGMELHAWFNPYRAYHKQTDYELASNQITKTHPAWILKFKDLSILNPGIPAVNHYIAKIIADVVRRYDVDGIHFDDYFYPYSPKIKNEDAKTFLKYQGRFTNIADWRRNNINQMVAEVYDSIKSINPRVKFGISPFGIVENKFAYTKGMESYNILYADPVTWLKDKTVDYILPQLYWAIGNKAADYASLLPWWALSAGKRQVYVGLFSTKIAAPDYKGSPTELESEINLSRQMIRTFGTCFYSAKSIALNYSHFADSLKVYYKHPSLIPAMPWIDSVSPLTPANLSATEDSSSIILTWNPPPPAKDLDTAYKYVIYRFDYPEQVNIDDAWHIMNIQNGGIRIFSDTTVDRIRRQYTYAVTALDRLNNESPPKIFTILLNKIEVPSR